MKRDFSASDVQQVKSKILLYIFKVKRSELRKGMFIVSEKVNPNPSWEFEAEILILHHPTTISVNYQAMGKSILPLFIISHLLSLYFNVSILFRSALWKYSTNSEYFRNVRGAYENRRQSHLSLRIYQKSRVLESGHKDDIQRR